MNDSKIQCPACNSTKHSQRFVIRGFTYYNCDICNLLYLHKPEVIIKSVEKQYDSDYFKDTLKEDLSGYMDYLKQSTPFRMNFRRFLSYIQRHIQVDDTKSILDIGCAYGFLIDEARKMGMQVHGVDLSESAIKWMKEKLGIEGTVGISSNAPGGPFDIITSIEVIEHIYEPKIFLHDIHMRLKKEGILLIHTGAINSVTAKLLGRWWWYLNPPDHCNIYSMSALREIVVSSGFEILEHRILPYHWVGLNNMVLKIARITESKRLGILASRLPALVMPVFQFCGQLMIARKAG